MVNTQPTSFFTILFLISDVFVYSEFISSYFKLDSCSDQNKVSHNTISQTFTSAPTVIACAVSSIQDNKRTASVFFPGTKECHQTSGLNIGISQLVFSSPNSQNTTDGVCTVLSKIGIEDNVHFIKWERVDAETLRQLPYAEFLPLKIMLERRFISATYSFTNSTSYFTLYNEQVGVALLGVSIKRPVYYIIHVYMQNEDMKTVTRFNLFERGGVSFIAQNQKTSFDIAVRNDFKSTGLNAGFVTTNSTELLITSLLNGYRRVQRGPYPSRALIEIGDTDVHFDTTEMYVVKGPEDMDTPIYYTSIKESVKTGKRYEFRHQANAGSNSLPCMESEADAFWVLDKSWIKLEPETMMDTLRENILEGRELRLVMGRTISTDLISYTVTSNDVIVTLAKYLMPFKGIDSRDAATQLIRFPILGLRNKTLVECEMEFLTNNLNHIYNKTYSSNLEWYVSSRNWTNVLEIKPNRTVVSGDIQYLHEVAKDTANNVRVCVVEISGNTVCHGTDKIYTFDDRIVLQSVPVLQAVIDGSDTLQGVQGHCERSHRLIEAGGKIESVNFVVGRRNTVAHTILYERQDWFVEY